MLNSLESPVYSIHSAFGLRFRSRLDWLPLRRVEDASSRFDVDVTFGSAPADLGEGAFKTPRFEVQPGRLLFKTRTIADYLVEDGRRILIHPKPEADELRLCNLLFGAVTGGLLIQRGTLALHGCSIETPSGAMIFCGDSGAGKSTLATLLLERGFRILDDNIAALDVGGGEFRVQPGLGYLRLTGDTLMLLNKRPEGPGYHAPFEKKYLHFPGSNGFCSDARPLRHIFILDRTSALLEQPLRGKVRLAVVRRYTFMGHMAPGLGQLENHFRRWLELADGTPMSRLGQPPELGPETWAEKVADLIGGR